MLRDARITPIYEGTNGIQAMTLAGRLLRLDNGACPAAFRADMLSVADDTLNAALADWDRATETVANLRDPGAVAVPYLRLSGLLALAAAWNRLEAAAEQAPNPARIRAAADFTRRVLLPETRVLADIIAAPADLAGLEERVFA